VIPTFNRKKFLARAINSIITQSKSPDEIIVVDDGSSDGTETLVKNNYPRISYYRQSNKGVSAARNLGIRKSSGQIIAFLDSDDEWVAEKLEKQIEFIIENPTFRFVHCDETWFKNGKIFNQKKYHKKRGGFLFFDSLKRCSMSPSAVIVCRTIFNDYGLFDESLPACEDYDLWLRISRKEKIGFIDEALVKKHGGHDGQLSKTTKILDYFRVQSIYKLIQDKQLNDTQEDAAYAVLTKKIEIVKQGAIKHNNLEQLKKIEQLECQINQI